MGRGKQIEKPEDLYRRPYTIILDLFNSIENNPLKFDELRYILLEDPGLIRLKKFPIKKLELENRKILHSNELDTIKDLRSKIKKLVNTTGPNKGKPMNVNGLNNLLISMKDHRTIQQTDNGYSLSEVFCHRFHYRTLNYKMNTCPNEDICILQNGLLCFNLNIRKLGIDEKNEKYDKNVRKINRLLSQLSDTILDFWVRQQLEEFYNELRNIKNKEDKKGIIDRELTTEFYAYCVEMTKWLIKSSNQKIEKYKDQIEKIEMLLGEGELQKCNYPKNIIETRKKLEKKIIKMPVKDLSNIKDKKSIEKSLLDAIGIISENEKITTIEAIKKLVSNKQLSEKDGNLLINEQELYEQYWKLGLDTVISSMIFDRKPIIVYDIH